MRKKYDVLLCASDCASPINAGMIAAIMAEAAALNTQRIGEMEAAVVHEVWVAGFNHMVRVAAESPAAMEEFQQLMEGDTEEQVPRLLLASTWGP